MHLYSAFITKAEFEALKESFAGQINNYNTSIDNKIDGAIASYLNGVNLAKEQQESIIMSDWADVTCYNGSWAPTYSLPSVNIGFTYIHCWPRPFETSAPTTSARTGWWNLLMTYKYNNPGIDYCYRPLITGDKITFTAERDAIIYAKWVPNTTSFATDTWYSTLKLEDCNQYKYTEES